MNQTSQIKKAEKELIKLDSKLGVLIKSQDPIVHQPRTDYFNSLCRSIIGQQVSVAAAATIFGRFDSITDVESKRVVMMRDEDVKTIGLSRQKASYLHDLSERFVRNPQIYDHLEKLSDEEVIAELVAVKGIGIWTAQMFLMFTMTRLDVFAPDDVGVQRAMKQLYGWEELPEKAALEATADKWRPYRTVACWHLWKSLQNTSA